ncbi:hypothetical protein JHK82_055827 [Glycine max]|nr:hypothetical protein JHK87_055914 [Glycine soja]KAG5074462.1 hypothetical protein JHK84_055693 [Glycine max]KAG5077132.1 hypothetical protein JHK82_055827 [Glycine max]
MSSGSEVDNFGDFEGSSLWLRWTEVFDYEDVSTSDLSLGSSSFSSRSSTSLSEDNPT